MPLCSSRLFIRAFTLTVLAMASGRVALAAPPSGQSYKLIFADEFSGSTLDSFKWNYNYPWGTGHTHNHAGYADASQVKFSNGVLDLHAAGIRNPNAVDFNHDQFGWQSMDYTVGVINTQGKLNINEGYIESSMKLDASMGSWPALWMLGNGWPPEIDIMEFPRGTGSGLADTTSTYMMNYHYVNASNAIASYYKRDAGIPFDLTTAFHTYGLEWTPTTMKFSIDGLVRHTVNDSAAIADAVNMYLLLNHGVDGWADTPANPSLFDAAFLVNYVRVYQRNTNASPTTTWQGTASSGSWDTSTNWTVQVPKYQDLTAVWNTLSQSSLSVTWSNSRAVGGLRFNTNAPVSLGNSNSSLQIASSGAYATIEVTSTNTATHNIATRLDLWSDVRVNNNSANNLFISGKIVGDKAFLKGGSGMVQLLGSNTLTGGVGFYGGTNSGDSGILRLSNSNALGSGVLTMPGTNSASQIVELTNFIQINNDLTTGGRDQPIFLRNAGGNNTWAGNLTIANSGGSYAIDAASGVLTLAGQLSTSMPSAPSDRVFTLQGVATGNITGTVVDGATVKVGLAKTGTGTWSLVNANTYSAGTTVSDGKLLVRHVKALGSGSVVINGGTLELESNIADAVVVPSLVIDNVGKLELHNNGVVINTDSASLPAALVNLRTDLAAGGVSSDLLLIDTRLAVGYASADVLQWTSFRNVSLDTDAIVLLPALKGDSNLDASVDFADLLKLAQGYGSTDRLWTDGDFNYDGAIDFGDLLALAQTYGGNLSLDSNSFSSDFQSDWTLALSLVPEPTSISIMLLSLPMVFRRR